MDVAAELDRARECYRRQAWADACDAYQAIDRVMPLAIEDLELLAESAHILGRGDDAVELLQRVYEARAGDGTTGRAVRTAFFLWHALVAAGSFARAGGWIARAWRLVESEPNCAELGYLLIPDAERQVGEGDFAGAFATASRMAELAGRIGDRDLIAVAAHIQGRARIKQGRVVHGLALLDEALVEVTAGATSAGVTSEFWLAPGGGPQPLRLHGPTADPFLCQASRPRLEQHVRAQVCALHNVTVIDRCDVAEPRTDAARRRVTGVRVLRRAGGGAGTGTGTTIEADLVVDATGRGSRAPDWLAALGYEQPRQEQLTINLMYLTRHFRLRPGALATKLVGGRRPAGPAERVRPAHAGGRPVDPDRVRIRRPPPVTRPRGHARRRPRGRPGAPVRRDP